MFPGAPDAAIPVPIRKRAATAFRPYSGLDWANRSKRFDNRLSISQRLRLRAVHPSRTSAAPPTNSPPKSRRQRLEHLEHDRLVGVDEAVRRCPQGRSRPRSEHFSMTHAVMCRAAQDRSRSTPKGRGRTPGGRPAGEPRRSRGYRSHCRSARYEGAVTADQGFVQPHIRALSTSTSQPGEDGSKPCSTSQRIASRLRNDHHARITSRSTSVP